jgi:hypothetical protein
MESVQYNNMGNFEVIYIINRVAHSGCLHGGNNSFYLERLYGVSFDH